MSGELVDQFLRRGQKDMSSPYMLERIKKTPTMEAAPPRTKRSHHPNPPSQRNLHHRRSSRKPAHRPKRHRHPHSNRQTPKKKPKSPPKSEKNSKKKASTTPTSTNSTSKTPNKPNNSSKPQKTQLRSSKRIEEGQSSSHRNHHVSKIAETSGHINTPHHKRF